MQVARCPLRFVPLSECLRSVRYTAKGICRLRIDNITIYSGLDVFYADQVKILSISVFIMVSIRHHGKTERESRGTSRAPEGRKITKLLVQRLESTLSPAIEDMLEKKIDKIIEKILLKLNRVIEEKINDLVIHS